jgi:enoyl-[acyl-carrier-protein] reductase (NADH)
MMTAEDVAGMAVFLLGDAARAITGDVVSVDAGWCVS